MPVREVIPRHKRERTSNYGDTESVKGPNPSTLFSWSSEQADDVLITVETVEFAQGTFPGSGAPTVDVRPYINVKWGHGGTDNEQDFEVTYRQRIPLVASKVDVECFLKALPLPGATDPTLGGVVPADAFAKFRGWVGEGIDGLPLTPTRWIEQYGAAANGGVLVVGQARLANLRAFRTAGGTTDYLLLFDKASPAVNNDIPVDAMALPLVTANSNPLKMDLGNTRAFRFGAVWAVSTTPYVLTLDAAAAAFVSAEFVT